MCARQQNPSMIWELKPHTQAPPLFLCMGRSLGTRLGAITLNPIRATCALWGHIFHSKKTLSPLAAPTVLLIQCNSLLSIIVQPKLATSYGWWLYGCRGSVAEHWQLKPEVSWDRLPVTAGLFYFCLIASEFLYIQHEARTLSSYTLLGLVPRLPHGVCA